MTDHNIGVDISKSHLDVFRLEDGAAQRFDNSTTGFRALIKWLGNASVARVVFEPTGAYHKAFEVVLGGGIAAGQGQPVAGAQVCRSLWHEGQDRCSRCPDVGAYGGRVRP